MTRKFLLLLIEGVAIVGIAKGLVSGSTNDILICGIVLLYAAVVKQEATNG